MLVHEEERDGHPVNLHRVIEVVPLLPKGALVQVEKRVPEPLLVGGHALEQGSFDALGGKEADQRGGVDRNVVRHDAGAQTERLEQLALHLFQHAVHVELAGQVALGIGFRVVRQADFPRGWSDVLPMLVVPLPV